MDDSRITKRIFMWERKLMVGIKDMGMLDSFLNSRNCPVQSVWATLNESECHKWS